MRGYDVMTYVKTGFAKGEKHHQAKLTDADVYRMRQEYATRSARLLEIDNQIALLEQERREIKRAVNHKQLAFNFGVATVTVARILRFEMRA